ncbi:S8 family serine peptidase [Cellulomonas sp. NPDC058312]|uniref:S8 family serine peptidase n=1 Tax=Cellulomonas sp. NPDC058312 TaxID=3346441 RepID=UPI0036F07F81
MRPTTTPRAAHGLAVAALLGSSVFLAPTASAATDTDGLWYFTHTGIAEAQQIANGAGVNIALIDSTVNPSAPDLVGTNLSVREPSYCAESEGGEARPATGTSERAQHTTTIAALLIGTGAGFPGDPGIKGVAPGAHVTVYDRTNGSVCPVPGSQEHSSSQAFADAVAAGADVVVVPGETSVPSEDLSQAVRAGVIVIGAGGNRGGRVSGEPATRNGAIATGTTTVDGSVDPGSTSGPELGRLAPGTAIRTIDPTLTYYGTSTGSSHSSVITAGVIALAMSAHPEATSNQILQAVVRTTDGSVHEPVRDETRGYGAIDVRQLMTVDPTTLPDLNPFIRTDADAFPTAEDLGVISDTESTPTSSPTAPGSGTRPATLDEPETGPNLLVIGGSIAGAVALAAVTVTVVMRRRPRHGPTG